MGDKKKKATIFIRLVSAAGTGFFYVKKKPSRMVEKLEFRKFDPRSRLFWLKRNLIDIDNW
ncbi:hypothetical protein G4B88_015358 [Cannabis sativa]|uniref:50S ribosomal protein L33, chloroplastic n=1 Tax=Cannabis sativa TaxID=3483 RepID=A0A7J6ECC1_CANSA|nr:hypothetical protein G4B88_015358 [Cannabis sativa]